MELARGRGEEATFHLIDEKLCRVVELRCHLLITISANMEFSNIITIIGRAE